MNNNHDNNIKLILSVLSTIAFFSIVFYILSSTLNNMNKDSAFIVGNLIGISGTIIKDVFNYYFGSSADGNSQDIKNKELK